MTLTLEVAASSNITAGQTSRWTAAHNRTPFEFQRKDEYTSHRIGVVFRIIRNTGLGLMLNIWERDSNDFRWGNRNSMFLGGYITFEF